MAEPASSTAGVAIAAGTITLTGTFLGVHYDALLAGFAGGLVSLTYLPAMPRSKIAGTVAGSSILAGYFAPVIAAGAQHYFPWLEAVGDFMRLASAAGLGVSAQAVIPAALNWVRKQGGAQ
ncbi:MAG TPA: restriction endonuclease [Noviherbaspirillum sp.]|nr:restriction endonuclease [Noviherbaspirillum sp.]